ncbi:putative Early nodulin 20 precursor [Planoprotostelium fungivorum]|uniref:Putative Early nodulin 20 n=1 Tax=Planoprotostelium fungivorum TaxID=1890364 RepID=A0A2P6NM91_9EUKA|nr:hypothetical protein PROFUN_07320 [Planoprotostelium fungivorum]PRP85337.1 putative Early nodulin 20 precursor [Planoprotostelium fungivorum]
MHGLRHLSKNLNHTVSPVTLTPRVIHSPSSIIFTRPLSGGATKAGRFRTEYARTHGLHELEDEPEPEPIPSPAAKPTPTPTPAQRVTPPAQTTFATAPKKTAPVATGPAIRLSEISRAQRALMKRLAVEGVDDKKLIEVHCPSKRAREYEEKSGIRITGQNGTHLYMELPETEHGRVVIRLPKERSEVDEYNDNLLFKRLQRQEHEKHKDNTTELMEALAAREKNMENNPLAFMTLTFDIEIIPNTGQAILLQCRNMCQQRDLEFVFLAINDEPLFVDQPEALQINEDEVFQLPEELMDRPLTRYLELFGITSELGPYAKWIHMRYSQATKQSFVIQLQNFLGGN